MRILSRAGLILSSPLLALCFSGVAFADGNTNQGTDGPIAQRISDPSSLEKISTSEYARAQAFTDGALENTPESIEASKDVQIPDARQFTAKADATDRPIRVFEVVSHDSQFAPVGESTPPVNGEMNAPASFLDNPEYYILLIFGMVLLVSIAFGRRYRLDPVGSEN